MSLKILILINMISILLSEECPILTKPSLLHYTKQSFKIPTTWFFSPCAQSMKPSELNCIANFTYAQAYSDNNCVLHYNRIKQYWRPEKYTKPLEYSAIFQSSEGNGNLVVRVICNTQYSSYFEPVELRKVDVNSALTIYITMRGKCYQDSYYYAWGYSFIIIICVVPFTLYLLCIGARYLQGNRGIEILPYREEISEFPLVVKDGIEYFISNIKAYLRTRKYEEV